MFVSSTLQDQMRFKVLSYNLFNGPAQQHSLLCQEFGRNSKMLYSPQLLKVLALCKVSQDGLKDMAGPILKLRQTIKTLL